MKKAGSRNIFLLIFLVGILEIRTAGRQLSSYEHMKPIEPMNWSMEDGSLILSNSPESIKKPGILYRGRICGKGRIVYHHVNRTSSQALRLFIWVENEEDSPKVISIGPKSMQEPSGDYLRAGESALSAYFKSRQQHSVWLQPHERLILYSTSPTGWPKGSVLTGIIDIHSEGSVAVYAVAAASLAEVDKLSILEKSVESRGKFQTLTICQYVLLPDQGRHYYLIEDEREDWQKGKDEITGENVINYGNYGIIYKIMMAASVDTNVYICPRGGIFQGVIRWDDGRVIPVKRSHAFKYKKEMIRIAQLRKGETKTFEYMLSNGSAAPILLGFEMNE